MENNKSTSVTDRKLSKTSDEIIEELDLRGASSPIAKPNILAKIASKVINTSKAINSESSHGLVSPQNQSSRRPTSDLRVKASLTNALLQELVKTYEQQERDRRKEDLDYYFKAKSEDEIESHGVPDAEIILYEELQTIQDRLWRKEECYLSLEKNWKEQSEEFKKLRQRNEDEKAAHRACQELLADCQQKLANWRMAAEKRADDDDEMEKLVVSLNKKVNDLETQRYKDAERARQRLEVAEAEWRKDLKVVVSQRDMLVKDEEAARKETEEVREEEERKRKKLADEARREMEEAKEEEERKREKLTEENRAKLTRIRRLMINLIGAAKCGEEMGVEEMVEEEKDEEERINEALEQAKKLLAECKSNLMVSETDIQLHDLRQELEDMRKREMKSGEILEKALQEKDEIMKRSEKLRGVRMKDQTGEEDLKKKIAILEVAMGKSQKSHEEEKRMLRDELQRNTQRACEELRRQIDVLVEKNAKERKEFMTALEEMESNHATELLSIESSNKITSHGRLVEERRNWEHEQNIRIREIEINMENERQTERNRLLDMVREVKVTEAMLEEELNEEERIEEERIEEERRIEKGRRLEEVAEERQKREQLEENLSRFRRGMKATLENMERERITREAEEAERERVRIEAEEKTERRIVELTERLEERRAAREELNGLLEENEQLKAELVKLTAEKDKPRESREEAGESKNSLCEIDIEMFNPRDLGGMGRSDTAFSRATSTRESKGKLDQDSNFSISSINTIDEVPKPENQLMAADLAESRRIIAAEVIGKLIDKVEILESLQSSSSRQRCHWLQPFYPPISKSDDTVKKYQNALKVLKDQLGAEKEFSRKLEEHLKHLLSDSKGETVSLAHLGLTRLGQKNLKNRVMNSFVVEEVDDLVEAQQKKNEQEGVEELSSEELMRENNALVQRMAELQQEKWDLEHQVATLSMGSAANSLPKALSSTLSLGATSTLFKSTSKCEAPKYSSTPRESPLRKEREEERGGKRLPHQIFAAAAPPGNLNLNGKSSWSSLWKNLRTKREAWREMDKNVIFNYDFYSDTTEDVDEELPEINEFELEEALGITPMKLY